MPRHWYSTYQNDRTTRPGELYDDILPLLELGIVEERLSPEVHLTPLFLS